MKICKSILTLLAVMALASTAVAQVHGPALGVYFDDTASSNMVTGNGLMTGYVFVTDANTTITGAAFRLYFSYGLNLVSLAYPDEALGIVTDDGIWVGLHTPRGCYGDDVVQICSFLFSAGELLLNNAPISIVDHLSESDYGIHICDHNFLLIEVNGDPGYVSVVTANESSSWGGVKNLYR